MSEILLEKDAVAKRLSISERTVERLVASGELPHIRISPRRIRFTQEIVDEFIEQRTTKGAYLW